MAILKSDHCNSASCHSRSLPCILYSVKGIPGTLQEGGAAFATTHWSVVEACADDNEIADWALAWLCQDSFTPPFNQSREGQM